MGIKCMILDELRKISQMYYAYRLEIYYEVLRVITPEQRAFKKYFKFEERKGSVDH
jgi:hypothetical protein